MTTSINQFEDNFHGILTHNGEIKIAKGDVNRKSSTLMMTVSYWSMVEKKHTRQ